MVTVKHIDPNLIENVTTDSSMSDIRKTNRWVYVTLTIGYGQLILVIDSSVIDGSQFTHMPMLTDNLNMCGDRTEWHLVRIGLNK
jgi:hypothetical protein